MIVLSTTIALNPKQTPTVELKPHFSYLFDQEMVKISIDNMELIASEQQLEEIANTILEKLPAIKLIKGVA